VEKGAWKGGCWQAGGGSKENKKVAPESWGRFVGRGN